MYRFSKKSKAQLDTLHPDLQRLLNEVIKHIDCKILEGHRPKEKQDALFYGTPQRTKVKWPNSKHNSYPSMAVDVVPFPVRWPSKENSPDTYDKDLARFYYFVGLVKGIAIQLGIKIRVGADWDGDNEFLDQSFDDLPHIELVD